MKSNLLFKLLCKTQTILTMAQEKKKDKLLTEFPPITTQQWEEVILKDLKGADYDKRLVWHTIEGLKIRPYYRSEDLEKLDYLKFNSGEAPFVRGRFKNKNNSWEIRQDIYETDPKTINAKAKDAVQRGANAIGIRFKSFSKLADLELAFDGINLEELAVHIVSSKSYPASIDLFQQYVAIKGYDIYKIKGSVNFDSISYLLLYGKFYTNKENDFVEAAYLLNTIKQKLPKFNAIVINGHFLHNAGASIVQELAFSLASGNEYLAELTNKGIVVDDIADKMQFSFGIGANYFMEIAKIRAARLLWSRIVEQYKPAYESSKAMYIHASTSLWNKTIYDPYVNVLRTTTEAMSAIIGGIDSMSVIPFDLTYKQTDELSERLARNAQIILKEEAYLDQIVDPSAGSYYIETITDAIAQAAWKLFQAVEEKEGYMQCLTNGFIYEEIKKVCQERDVNIATRKNVLVGTNQFPNTNESMLDKIQDNKLFDYPALKLYRGAEAFENLRLATEKHVKAGRKQPVFFLFNIGNLAMRKARATFISNFVGCAGYKVVDNNGFEDVEAGVKAAMEAKADAIVICSSDEEYATLAPEIAKQMKAVQPQTKVIVAGYPKDIIDTLKNAGVDDFIHIKSNVLDTLKGYHANFGIKN